MVIDNLNSVTYQGDGVTTRFDYTFAITQASDVKAMVIAADGTETQLASDYYVDTVLGAVFYPGYAPGAEPPEASRPPVLAEGERILIYRELPITQERDLGDKWPFNVIEKGLDKLTMILQGLMRSVENAWDARGQRITNVAEPKDAVDAVTKEYVDEAIDGLMWDDGDGTGGVPKRFKWLDNFTVNDKGQLCQKITK